MALLIGKEGRYVACSGSLEIELTGNKEVVAIRKAISKLTGADYEFQEPSKNFPPSKDQVTWPIVARVPLRGRSTTVAPVIWEEGNGRLCVESNELGSTSDWVYELYGERGAEKSQAMEQDFSKGDIKEVLNRHFPLVYKRALRYESILAEVASSGSINLSAECSRNGFVVTLYAMARIEARNLGTQEKIEKIKLGIDAIRKTLSEINKFEVERVKSRR